MKQVTGCQVCTSVPDKERMMWIKHALSMNESADKEQLNLLKHFGSTQCDSHLASDCISQLQLDLLLGVPMTPLSIA